MHAAIRSPLAAGVALLGAGAIAATPIAATPPDVHISDLRLTLAAQPLPANPVTAAERLVRQTATDAATQAARIASFPIPMALLLNVSSALGGGGVAMAKGPTAFSAAATTGTTAPALAGVGGGLLGGGLLGGVVGTVASVVQDGVATTIRLVPATIDAVTGVIISTINAPIQIGVTTLQALLNVGAAVLSLSPGAVINAVALGAVRIAGVIEQTTIGAPAAAFTAPMAETADTLQADTAAPVRLGNGTPSILTSILNGRDEIANAINPLAAKRAQSLAVPTAAQTTAALTPAVAAGQNGTPTAVVKTLAKRTHKASSAPKAKRTASSALKAIHTSAKHAK
jgi:hypothetical protein